MREGVGTYCKASPPAAIAAVACTPIIVAGTRLQVTTAPAKISSMAADSTASTSAVGQLSKPLPMLFWKPSHQPRCEATMLSVSRQLQSNHDAAVAQWRLEVERARYEAERAERRYRGRGAGESAGRSRPGDGVGRPAARSGQPPKRNCAAASNNSPARLTPNNSSAFRCSAPICDKSGTAPTTTDRDRKELLRTLLEEVILNLKRAEGQAHLTLRWRGGAITVLDICGPTLQTHGAAHR